LWCEKKPITNLRDKERYQQFRTEGVRDLDESVQEEATIVKPLRQQPYGAWEFEVKDSNGYVLVFSEMG
jgi:uncharacterized glyoxalase superfamily protein PhnB